MRAWNINHQGVEAPRPQVFTQKYTQRGIKLHTTPRDGAEHGEGEADAQGKGKKEHEATTRDRKETGPPVKEGRGRGSRPGDGGGRQREEGNHGRDNPGADRDLITQVEDGKGGESGKGKADTGLREKLLGIPSREESADKKRRPVGGGAVQVDSHSTPGRDGGGEAGAHRERRSFDGCHIENKQPRKR